MRRLCGNRAFGNILLHFGQLYSLIYSGNLQFGQGRQGNMQSRIVHLSDFDISHPHWLHTNGIAHLEASTCLSNINIVFLTITDLAKPALVHCLERALDDQE